jgi:hypothetical protein
MSESIATCVVAVKGKISSRFRVGIGLKDDKDRINLLFIAVSKKEYNRINLGDKFRLVPERTESIEQEGV